MSLQNIIDNATQIVISRNRLSGSTISRSGRIRSGFVAGGVPFNFTVSYQPMATYADVRGVLEEIDRLDTYNVSNIDIGGTNSGLSWVTAYQGDLNSTQIAAIDCTGTTGAMTMDLDLSSITGATGTDVVLKKGDYFQPDSGYKYPYTVTSDVLYGVGGTVTVNLNRPYIAQSGYTLANKGILVGNDVTWQVKMLSKPSYVLLPSRYVEFTGEFALIEVLED